MIIPKTDRFLELGKSYRWGKGTDSHSDTQYIDDHENWFYVTDNFESSNNDMRGQQGIWSPAQVKRAGKDQIPLIICSTSPHKSGSIETPWTDSIRPDDGYVIYYGDNKTPGKDPTQMIGNKKMLRAMQLQGSNLKTERELAPPILIVTTHGLSGSTSKGYRRVEGIGVITRAEIINQRSPGESKTFQNLRFDIAVLELKDDNDIISMEWINARRNKNSNAKRELENAPKAWKDFVKGGIPSVDRLRRDVLKTRIVDRAYQLPEEGRPLSDLLTATINYFDGNKHGFEALAARTVERVFDDQGLNYKTGWLTPRSNDGGYDFVGRIDFDPDGGFPSSRQVVLGQAKCERNPTSGKDLARLAARLRRGWHGAYVTTGYFTPPVQKEVLVDKYPLLMVPGIRVAAILKDEMDLTHKTLADYLSSLQENFEKRELGLSDVESVLF